MSGERGASDPFRIGVLTMFASPLALGEYDFPDRNRRAKAVIESTAVLHAGADAAIGLAGIVGGLFVPGAGAVAVVAALVTQAPVYRSLARELSAIYETPQDTIT